MTTRDDARVQRYSPGIDYNAGMDEDSTGEYVLHSDYAALLAEHEALLAMVEAAPKVRVLNDVPGHLGMFNIESWTLETDAKVSALKNQTVRLLRVGNV